MATKVNSNKPKSTRNYKCKEKEREIERESKRERERRREREKERREVGKPRRYNVNRGVVLKCANEIKRFSQDARIEAEQRAHQTLTVIRGH